jgi:hypothetical protein
MKKTRKQNKLTWSEIVLGIGFILFVIQWIRQTFIFIGLSIIGREDIILSYLESYYLIMIGTILCVGFLYLGRK